MSQSKKKKQPKNAFYFYMVHFRSQEESKGVRFKGGMKDVAEKAAPVWKSLDANKRWIYEEEARKEKERDKFNLENKFTTQGKSYAQLEREKSDAIDQQMRMTQEIEGTVRSLDYNTSLPTYPFYLIHVNYYCRQENGMYTPCEIALAEFNFADGVRKVYHTLINPGSIPLGYKYAADKHSEETHQIPVPPEEFGGENDYQKILNCIKHFLTEQRGHDSYMPPVYTQPNCMDSVKNILRELQDQMVQVFRPENIRAYNIEPENDMFRVYPLPKLFYEVRNACVSKPGGIGFPAFSLAERELDKDVFNFTKGISCEFHEKTDALPHCSLSCVRRWAFLIMDHCCKDLGIDLIPGQHCPKQSDTTRFQKIASRMNDVFEDAPRPSASAWRQANFVDHGKLAPDPQSGQHFTLGATPGVVTVNKTKPSKKESIAPLRPPKTTSLALALMGGPEFTDDDFPAIGRSKRKEPKELTHEVPCSMMGRGRMAARLANPISLGRGRPLETNLDVGFKNLNFD